MIVSNKCDWRSDALNVWVVVVIRRIGENPTLWFDCLYIETTMTSLPQWLISKLLSAIVRSGRTQCLSMAFGKDVTRPCDRSKGL